MSIWSDLKEDFGRIKSGEWISVDAEAKAAVAEGAATVKRVLTNAVSSGVAAMSTVNYSGSTGDFTSAYETISLYARFIPVTETNPTNYGSPLMKNVTLNTFSGFVLCENPHFSLSIGMISEAEIIRDYMEKGFFFE